MAHCSELQYFSSLQFHCTVVEKQKPFPVLSSKIHSNPDARASDLFDLLVKIMEHFFLAFFSSFTLVVAPCDQALHAPWIQPDAAAKRLLAAEKRSWFQCLVRLFGVFRFSVSVYATPPIEPIASNGMQSRHAESFSQGYLLLRLAAKLKNNKSSEVSVHYGVKYLQEWKFSLHLLKIWLNLNVSIKSMKYF